MKRLAVFIVLILLTCLTSCAVTVDDMKITELKSYQFVIFKANDEFFEADNDFIRVYSTGQETAYPEMSNGEFAFVTADVRRHDGGIGGFRGNKFIDKLISYEIIGSDEAAQRCGIPEVGEADFSYENKMLMYHSGENIYCVFFHSGN